MNRPALHIGIRSVVLLAACGLVSNGPATAQVMGPAEDPLVLVLNPTAKGAFQMKGGVKMVVAGKLHVNSTHACGINMLGNPFKLQAYQVSVVGGACYQDGAIVGAVLEGADVAPDPHADILPDSPAWDAFKAGLLVQPGSNGLGAIEAPGTYPPGYYPGGVRLNKSMFVVLDPSSNHSNPYFMFGGAGLSLGGSSFVLGDGVTIFIDKGATVGIKGNGAGLQLAAPGFGEFQGISLFHHRENAGDAECSVGGGGLVNVTGLVYVPSGGVALSASSGKAIGGIVCDTLRDTGSTGYTITGQGVPAGDAEPLALDLGLPGLVGTPMSGGEGLMTGGSPFALRLAVAAPFAQTVLVLGSQELNTPFLGGTLVPRPDVLLFGLQTNEWGRATLAATWPDGLPSGTDLTFQWWIRDLATPMGFSASNPVRATTP